MFWVRDLKLKLDQSDVSKVTRLTQKSHSPSLSSYKLNVTMKYLKKKKIQQNCLALMRITYDLYNYNMIYIIITPLHTSTFSLTIIIKHLDTGHMKYK